MKLLEIRRATRHRRAQQSFLDFVVSGRSLYEELFRRGFGYVSCLGWLADPHDQDARARLLLEQEGDLPSGRTALYICPECADLGCGAISVRILREGADMVWTELGHENNYEDGFAPLPKLGPFRFKEADYRKTVLTIA